MEYPKLMRQKLLSKYLCLFTCDFNQPRKGCPFWHPAQPEEEESHWHRKHAECTYECPPNIKPLPPYCCASFLALKCSKREYSFQCGAHSSAEILTRCEDGFHMELGEVDDLQLFAQKMAKVLLEASEYRRSEFKSIEKSVPGSVRKPMDVLKPLPSNYISAGHKRSRDVLFKDDADENNHSCAICLDPLRNNQTQIGHLDNCSHVFCAKCIHKWQNQGVNKSCPVCRKKISKILVWPKLIQSQEEKKQLFDLISGGVPSDERVDRAMAKGIRAYFKTFDGKTMSALHMKPESMKVFLEKPKPNWYCYIMTEMAVERKPNLNPIPVVTPSQASVLRVYSYTNRPSLTRHPPSIMTPINPNPINRTSNSNVEHIFASINSSATNNVVTNNNRIVTIFCNVAANRNARMNNRETNRSNNSSAISNVAPNIDSTTNLTAATNHNSTSSTVSNNVATNATNNNQTSESNSSRVRNPNCNPVRSASDVAVPFGSNRESGITVCGRRSIATCKVKVNTIQTPFLL